MLKRGLKGLAAFALVMTLSCLFAVEASAITIDGVGNNSLRVGADVYDLSDTASYTYDHVLASLRRGGSRYYFKMDSRWYDLLCDDINSFNELTNPAKAVPAVAVRGWQLTYWYGLESTVEDFEPVTYTLNYGAGANGSVAGSAAQAVEHGESGTAVTAVADPGCHFVKWSDGSTANPRTDTDVTADITVEAEFAAYVAGRNNRLYSEVHGGLKGALGDAEHGDTVTLLRNYTLTEDVTIPAGVILLLPCSATDTGYTATGFNPDGTTTGTADLAVLFRTLTVPAEKTVTIEGTVMVNAVTGRRNGGHLDQDITGGYSLIDLAGDIVVQSGGLLDVFGRVTGPGAVEALDGGSVGDLFVVRNWRGGTNAMYAYFRSIFPFNQYDLHNIETEIIINSGASYYGNVKMYADGKYHYTRFYQFDRTRGLIKLNSGAITTKSYHSATGQTTIMINGGAEEIGSSMKIAKESVSTADYFYPVDGHITLVLSNGDYTINNKLKFLPGSQLELGADATLTVKSDAQLVLYDEFIDPPNREGTEYPLREPAVLTLDNVLTVEGAFAGTVDAGESARIIAEEGASLKNTSQEMHGYPKDDGWVDEHYIIVTTKLSTHFDGGLAWQYHPTGGDSGDAILVAQGGEGSDYIDLGGAPNTYSGYTFMVGSEQRVGNIRNTTRGRYYFTIQGAVDAADPGDEIVVGKGTYNESIVIDRSVTLVGDCGDGGMPGAGDNPPLLDGDGIGKCAFRVNGASGVSIKGFAIRNYGGSGIVAEGNVHGATFACNSIQDVGEHGIQVYSDSGVVDGLTVLNNMIINVGSERCGVELRNVKHAGINNNWIYSQNQFNGIVLQAYAPGGHDISMLGLAVGDNVIHGSHHGVLIQPLAWYGVTATIEGISINGNSISSGERALLFSPGGDSVARIKNVSIAENELTSKKTVIDLWGPVENLSITSNTIRTENTDAGDGSWWVSGAAGLGNVSGSGVFSNNNLSADGFMGCGVWIQGTGTANWVINNNNLYGRGWQRSDMMGIRYELPGTTVEMNGNFIDDWFRGIVINSENTTAVIEFNELDRTAYGIDIAGSTVVLSLRSNRLMQYGNYSLLNSTGAQIDARYNYWGDAGGPNRYNNTWGPLLCDPWYTDEACTQTSDGSTPQSKYMEYSTPGKDSSGKC